MDRKINPGDMVECITSGVQGVAIRTYWPTACAQQLLVRTSDGRQYHAPYDDWRHLEVSAEAPHSTKEHPGAAITLAPEIHLYIPEACTRDISRAIMEEARKWGL